MADYIKAISVGKPLISQFRSAVNDTGRVISFGVTGGMRDVGQAVLARGRADIAASGNFGPRWTHGLKVDVRPRTGFLLNARMELHHNLWFAHIHEFGGIIRGKPLLWIPLSFAADAQGIWARDYAKTMGGLFSVRRKGGGRPLLFSVRDKKPKYFGIEQVKIPQRWHLRDIVAEEMNNFVTYYETNKLRA